jgi:hypothetical protein
LDNERIVGLSLDVLDLYRAELVNTCRDRRAQLFEKYDKLGIENQFPFRLDGPQMNAALISEFFDDLSAMNRDFKIDEGPYRIDAQGKKVPLYSAAQSIAMQLGNDQ